MITAILQEPGAEAVRGANIFSHSVGGVGAVAPLRAQACFMAL